MRSCEIQLVKFVKEFSKIMEHGIQTDIIILDFAKVFDEVNHCLLLHKLHHYEVCGRVNQWIQNFFEGRWQAAVAMTRGWTSVVFVQCCTGISLAEACAWYTSVTS